MMTVTIPLCTSTVQSSDKTLNANHIEANRNKREKIFFRNRRLQDRK